MEQAREQCKELGKQFGPVPGSRLGQGGGRQDRLPGVFPRGRLQELGRAGVPAPQEGQPEPGAHPRGSPLSSPVRSRLHLLSFPWQLLRQEHGELSGVQGAWDPRPTQPFPATESLLEADPRTGRGGPESGGFRSGRPSARPGGPRRRRRPRLRPSRRRRRRPSPCATAPP